MHELSRIRAYKAEFKLRSVCVACEDLHSSSQYKADKQGLEKKCGNHSAYYHDCPVYKEFLKRLKDRPTVKFVPPVFTMKKENFTKTTSVKSNEKFSVSYADALKSIGASTNRSETSFEFESCFQTLTQNLTTFTQNMTNIMEPSKTQCKNC